MHTVNNPAYYTLTSSLHDTPNFKYLYKVKDTTGTVFTGNSFPIGPAGTGIFDPSDVLKSGLSTKFQPGVKDYTPVPNWFYTYYLEVKEEYDGTTPQTLALRKNAGYSAWKRDFDIDSHIMKSHNPGEFLTLFGNKHLVRSDDEYTLRALNGTMDPFDTTRSSLIQRFKVEMMIHEAEDRLYLLEYTPNPYYNEKQSAATNLLEDLTNFVIDIPAGVINLDKLVFNSPGYWTYTPGSGVGPDPTAGQWGGEISPLKHDWTWHDHPQTNFTFPAVDWWNNGIMLWYNIYTYNDATGVTSEVHNFHPLVECKFEPVQVSWLNSIGGYDFFTFSKKNEEGKKFTNKVYERNPYELVGSDMVERDRGETIYFSEHDDFLTVMTDFLDQDDIDGLYDMFSSPDIHAKVDGKWYGMINEEKKAVKYNKNAKGFYQYEVVLKFANRIKYTV